MNLITSSAKLDRIERFQSLQAGQYWRAVKPIAEEGIEAGTVLLIESIRYAEDDAHTVILRPHPSKIGKRVTLEIPQPDGSTAERRFRYDEHRFLTEEFLKNFEHEPDYQRIRAEEIREVQKRTAHLQAELVNVQTDPAALARVVEDGLRQDQGGHDGAHGPALALRHETATPMSGANLADAIGSGITEAGIAEMRAAAQHQHKVATIKANWIKSKTAEIAETITAMTPYFEEQAAAALAATEDVRAHVGKLLEGIESLDLYVGKGVEVQTLREGAPAAFDVPLTFVQKKLLMDEELAVWADVDEWFDFGNEHLFFEALREHDGLVDQIFPTQRCVLVMATTRRYIDYGDRWANQQRNDENRTVFLLVRNGMNLHRVFSSVESHLGTDRLFPSRDEHDAAFRGIEGEDISLADVTYTDALQKHERMALHYKRFLLLACGLDHRLKLFGDFYEGPPSLRFVSLDFQERYCRFLRDDDEATMLSGPQRPSVAEWAKQANAFMRSGSRVLCNWRETMNPDTAPGACQRTYREYGKGFDVRYHPSKPVSLAIAYKDKRDLCVDVPVSGRTAGSDSRRSFNCKVTLSKLAKSRYDTIDMPFLCLDAVEPEEISWYIHHRGSRADHLSYIRFFKLALKHLLAERESEQDTRSQLAQALADGSIAAESERESIVNRAVIAWRAANRGKPLPKFDGKASSEWKALLDQMYALAGAAEARATQVAELVRDRGWAPLRLVLSGKAKLTIYAAPSAGERDDRLEPHAWVHRIQVELRKTKVSLGGLRWALLPAHAASETTLREWPEASEWSGRASVFPSLDAKARAFERAERWAHALRPFCATMDPAEHDDQVAAWRETRKLALAKSRYVANPSLVLPFGLVYYPATRELRYVCVTFQDAHALLARLAPDEARRAAVSDAFVYPFADGRRAQERIKAEIEGSTWSLCEATLQTPSSEGGIYTHHRLGAGIQHMAADPFSPLLTASFRRWVEDYGERAKVWLPDGVLADNGALAIDAALGVQLPEDYEPLRLRKIQLVGPSRPPKYSHWLDICPADPTARSDAVNYTRDDEARMLVTSAGASKDVGLSMITRAFISRRDARASIKSHVDDGLKAVPSGELEDAPQPPDGYERWYVIPASDDTAESLALPPIGRSPNA